MDAWRSGALLTNCHFSCSRLVLFFALVFSSVPAAWMRWQISSFCSLFLVEQPIRGIGHRASILSLLTSSFSMIILLYCSLELFVQIYCPSLIVFLGFVLVSLEGD